jgi:crotonobetainyl-CoA:carnitine CoA-transferase CaiB-like acyl-CoA transferase
MAELGFGGRRQRRAVIDQAVAAWLRLKPAAVAEAELLRAGIPAAALANSRDLVNSNHLKNRGFWEPYGSGALPGLPWQASFGRISEPAPELGGDAVLVLREVLDLSEDEIGALSRSGALG